MNGLKRWLACLLCALTLAPAASADSIRRFVPADKTLRFEVWRDGSRIGSHRMDFAWDGDRLTVDIAIELKVEIAYFTVFRYEHRNREVWQGDRLLTMDSRTDDDGTANRVQVAANAAGLDVSGTKFTGNVPAGMLATTYWRGDSIDRRQLISSQDGRIFEVAAQVIGDETIEVAGKPVRARHYAMRGDLDVDLWYNGRGEWSKLTFEASDGSLIEYRRVSALAPLEAHAE